MWESPPHPARAPRIESSIASDTPLYDLPQRRRELACLLGADEARQRLLMMTATKVMMAAMGMLAALVMVPPLMVAALVMLVEVGW